MQVKIKYINILLFLSSLVFSQNIPDYLKGLSDQEIATFNSLPREIQQRVIDRFNETGSSSNVQNVEQEIYNEDSVIRQSAPNNGIRKFGYSFFSGIPTTYTPINDIPVPGDYEIGIGDVLQINFRGQKTGRYDLTVNRSGKIYIPEIGELNVLNLTFDEVKKLIDQTFKQFYLSVEATVNLKELEFIQVSVMGAVKNPGTYLVNPFTTISNILSFAGGLEDFASLRSVKLKRQEEKIFDIYNFLINGDRERLNLKPGDIVFVESTSNFILVHGEVNRPAIYEYKEGDSISDLLRYAQDFKKFANKDRVQIKYFENEKIISKLISTVEDEINLANVTEIFVPLIIPAITDNVYVYGDVSNSGPYALDEYSLLSELIEDLKFSNDVYPYFGVVENVADKSNKNEYFPFSLHDSNTQEDINLNSGSRVFFFSKKTFLENKSYPISLPNEISKLINAHRVSFYGEFLNNTSLPVFGKASISNLIDYVGGFAPSADKSRLELILPLEEKTILNPDTTYELNSPLAAAINVPEFYSGIINVEITGEVNNPGVYPVLSGTTIEEIYKKAGGFKETASADAIVLIRDDLKESESAALEVAKTSLVNSLVDTLANNAAATNNLSINSDLISLLNQASSITPVGRLSGNLSPGSETSKNLLIKDGDKIFVPQVPQTITIFGEVSNQVTLTYSSQLDINDYVKLAGGLKPSAAKSEIFIIRSDGTSVEINQRMFSLNSYKLSAGDTIIVPKDLERVSGLPLVRVATDILSSIAFSAASLNAIRN